MKQSTIFLIIAIVVALIGNVFVYQMKTNPDSGFNRSQRISPRNPDNNYQWNDNWNGNNQNDRNDQIERDRDRERDQYDRRDQYEDRNPRNDNRPSPESQIFANSYSEALEKSRQSGKPALLFFDRNNCRYCDKMKQNVLTDPSVRQLLKQYVFVFINTSDRENREIAYRYKIAAAPTCVIVDSNENVIGSVRGYQEVQDYSSWLENPRSPEPERRFPFGIRR